MTHRCRWLVALTPLMRLEQGGDWHWSGPGTL
jgi:hypothetical protein